MNKRILRSGALALVGALGFTIALARAQDAALPEGKALVAKYIEATGGRAAYEKLKSRVTHSTIEVPAAGIKGKSESYIVSPDKAYITVDLGAAGKETRGTDGNVVWEMTTTGGPRIVSNPKELEFWRRAFDFNSDLKLDKYFAKVETTGTADVNGKPTYTVVLTTPLGQTETRYFDKASGLVLKVDQVVPSPMGAIPAVSVPGEYSEVDGVKMPRKVEETIAGQVKINATLDKIEHNANIPAEKFQLPPEVKALAARGAGVSSPATQPR